MSDCLCLSIQLLDPCFHGLRDRNRLLPEWPPAPSRAYQSLVAAAAARARGPLTEAVRRALEWLEQQPEPAVLAPRSIETEGYRTSVPHNEMDIVANAWSRGNYSNSGDANPATHKTMKAVKRTHLLEGDTIHYLWPLAQPISEELQRRTAILSDLARSVVALGWGIDMAVGRCAIVPSGQIQNLSGERWNPVGETGTGGLRVPTQGQLTNLIYRHERFLERPRPLRYPCRTVVYRRSFEPAPRAAVAFTLNRLDGRGYRPFDPVRHTLTVAYLMRTAVKSAARLAGWSDSDIAQRILGHGEARDSATHQPVDSSRLAFLPLPSIEPRGNSLTLGSTRRVMLTALQNRPEDKEEIKEWVAWGRRVLPGQDLLDANQQSIAFLADLPSKDFVLNRYLAHSSTWATVTPVVLPGYDDPRHLRRRLQQGVKSAEQHELLERLGARIETLLRKAITQAGFPPALAERAELDWRASGFWPGADLASRYTVPDYLERFPRLHVRLTWRDPSGRPLKVAGPICLGGGRFFGLGLFAASDRDA